MLRGKHLPLRFQRANSMYSVYRDRVIEPRVQWLSPIASVEARNVRVQAVGWACRSAPSMRGQLVKLWASQNMGLDARVVCVYDGRTAIVKTVGT